MKSSKCKTTFFALRNQILMSMIGSVVSEHILFILPIASKSHKEVFQPLYQGLAQRGHTVTVVVPELSTNSFPNVREIAPVNMTKYLKEFGNPIARRQEYKWKTMIFGMMFVFSACEDAFESEEFMSLLDENFDLIFIDGFMNDCFLGFIHRLDKPFIALTTIAAPSYIADLLGNRLPPSFVPSPFFNFPDEMTFLERLQNVVAGFTAELAFRLIYIPKYESIYRKYLGQDLPGWNAIYGKVEMLFMNSHFTINYPRPTLPDVIEIGGLHCRLPNPLPTDLDDFLSGASEGFILFSLGTVVQTELLPVSVINTFLNVFSRLKQRVLWKWNSMEVTGLPPNVLLRSWIPQQDVLVVFIDNWKNVGHPKIKLFITHGGLLSTQEAAYHGVPLIGIPIFGDQDLNIEMAERAGFALKLDILELTEQTLEEIIQKIIGNPSYHSRVKKLSELYRDKMQQPADTAIFWTEYFLRHKAEPYLRSAARNLNFFQYHSLDVIGFFMLVLFCIIVSMKITCTFLYTKLFVK